MLQVSPRSRIFVPRPWPEGAASHLALWRTRLWTPYTGSVFPSVEFSYFYQPGGHEARFSSPLSPAPLTLALTRFRGVGLPSVTGDSDRSAGEEKVSRSVRDSRHGVQSAASRRNGRGDPGSPSATQPRGNSDSSTSPGLGDSPNEVSRSDSRVRECRGRPAARGHPRCGPWGQLAPHLAVGREPKVAS